MSMTSSITAAAIPSSAIAATIVTTGVMGTTIVMNVTIRGDPTAITASVATTRRRTTSPPWGNEDRYANDYQCTDDNEDLHRVKLPNATGEAPPAADGGLETAGSWRLARTDG